MKGNENVKKKTLLILELFYGGIGFVYSKCVFVYVRISTEWTFLYLVVAIILLLCI